VSCPMIVYYSPKVDLTAETMYAYILDVDRSAAVSSSL